MCGIVGALTFDAFEKKTDERIRNEANIFVTTQLLQATVERGKDATGISALWADGNYAGLKMGIPSPDFIARFGETEKDFGGFLKLWREYPKLMKVFIGHCRKSSVGNSYDNKNNHPIQIGHTMLVHNGTLTNHEKIFEKLKSTRIGDVDSEAIGHLLNHYSDNGANPYTVDMVKEVTRRLAGTYHVLAMTGNNPYQVAQFRDGRPAEMVLVRPLKTVYIASEKKFLENVLFEYNKMAKLFAISSKFPYLKKADVEFKTLQDDSCAVWDLTIPIEDKTEIGDLYDWDKTPLRVDKIWGASTTTTTYTNTRSNYTAPGTGKKTGTEVDTTQKKTIGGASADDKDADGLVWSKSLNKYKTQEGIEKSKSMAGVIIDVEKGEITTLGVSTIDPIDFKEVDKDQVENLITSPATVDELALQQTEDAITKVIGDDDAKKNMSSTETKDGGDIIEIDMTADAEALKKAEEYVDKGLTKYETDEEVASDLEITDVSVLRPLPLHALANRVKKFIFKQGFIAGYVSRKTETAKEPANTGVEKKIRIMKFVIKTLALALETRTRGNTDEAKTSLITTALELADNTFAAARLNLGDAFSVGDLKNIPHLKDIKEQIEAKKK